MKQKSSWILQVAATTEQIPGSLWLTDMSCNAVAMLACCNSRCRSKHAASRSRLHINDLGVAFWIIAIPPIPLGIEVSKVNILHFLISSNVLASPFCSLITWSLHTVLGLVGHGSTTAGTLCCSSGVTFEAHEALYMHAAQAGD